MSQTSDIERTLDLLHRLMPLTSREKDIARSILVWKGIDFDSIAETSENPKYKEVLDHVRE